MLHTLLVAVFLVVTVVLLALTTVQRLRVREVILSWPQLSIVSAWPVIFVGVIGLLALYAFNTATQVPTWVFAGYVSGGIMWFVAAVVGTSTVVSRHGMVSGFGKRENSVTWVQVTDYFETTSKRRTHFVFLYARQDGAAGRLEVQVPALLVDRFRAIVNERLDQRQIQSPVPSRGPRATS